METLIFLAPLVAATLSAGTPLLLAGLGLLINERAGVLNLGAEGTMLMAAVTGFAITLNTGNPWLGVFAGAVCGALIQWFFAVFVVYLNTNQYATGLAFSLFGFGVSALVGKPYSGAPLPNTAITGIPYLSDIPVVGQALFSLHPMCYIAFALAVGAHYCLDKTRGGLTLRAVGESPESAHAIGLPVRRLRVQALMLGGALCGMAGAYLSVIYTPLWNEGMVAGRGWIALALTTFATWRPLRVIVGAYLFGGATMMQFHLQGIGVDVSPQLLNTLPYVATIVVLAALSRNVEWIRINMPASLGKPFQPS